MTGVTAELCLNCRLLPFRPFSIKVQFIASSRSLNTGPLKKELEKAPKELKGSATLEEEQQYELTSTSPPEPL